MFIFEVLLKWPFWDAEMKFPLSEQNEFPLNMSFCGCPFQEIVLCSL